jgi:hypothetical protein
MAAGSVTGAVVKGQRSGGRGMASLAPRASPSRGEHVGTYAKGEKVVG